jgi:hypothetical protein
MLAYVLGEFISIPSAQIELGLFGIQVNLTISTPLISAVLVAGLAITGTTWLMATKEGPLKVTAAQHWALPALSAWVLSITLSSMPAGFAWWAALLLGTAFIVIVWIAEYITVNPKSLNFRVAASGLTALSFALYLALTINLRALQTRMVYIIPALSIPAIFITARYLVLKLQAQNILDSGNQTTSILASGAMGVIAGQLATAMHFLPISALSYGLALIAPIYAINIYLGNLIDERPANRTLFEPILILTVLWISAIWLS